MTRSGDQEARAGRLGSLLAQVPVDATVKRHLCGLMSGADRFYHGIDHLALLWDRHCLYRAEAGLDSAEVDVMIACAIAFHDAIFDSSRRDNEALSAALWSDASARSPISDAARAWVSDTIIATRDHLAYTPALALPFEKQPLSERARLYFLDLDLSPIGEDPAGFALNTALLRSESPGLDETAFETGRLKFLARLESHAHIFRTPVLSRVFEKQARSNIARELASSSRSQSPAPIPQRTDGHHVEETVFLVKRGHRGRYRLTLNHRGVRFSGDVKIDVDSASKANDAAAIELFLEAVSTLTSKLARAKVKP